MTTGARTWTKIVSILTLLAGLIMVVAGIVAWSVVSNELASQKINVSTTEGKTNIANGPMDALSQINLIKKHTKDKMEGPATEGGFGYAAGTTYAMVPMPDAAELAQCKATQAKDTVNGTTTLSDACKTDIKNDAARTYLDNSNFKQASLYTSLMAFGVAFLVVGVGLCMLLIGSAIFVFSRRPAVVALEARKEETITV